MTPDDLAAIRYDIEHMAWGRSLWLSAKLLAMCDGLEQAWAERDRCERNWHWWRDQAESRRVSQEGAHEKIKRQTARIREVEGALARVRALCCGPGDRCRGCAQWDCDDLRAAIEGDQQ